MSELRRDIIRDKWVVIATDRALKPNDFPINQQGMQSVDFNGFCPFCEGNESYTPDEIAAYRPEASKANSPGWKVRTIPNKFSAFELNGGLARGNDGIYSSCNGLGKHEVLVETPQHGTDLQEYSLANIELILYMLKDRYNGISQDERIKYIHIYKNRGLFAGASLGHSHTQIVGLPLVPEENKGIALHFNKTGQCLLCAILAQEINDQKRVIYETNHFVLICPYASRFPYETWIIPRKHTAHFGGINEKEISDLAVLLKHFVSAMLESLNNPSYNIVFVSAPVNVECPSEGYHWYIELTPRLIVTAGLELGTGYYVNPVAPEISTSILRESLLRVLE
jgi:Galactose-1-phosphate uridylyltransferase